MKIFGTILFTAALVFTSVYFYRQPAYNWDTVAYTACVLKRTEGPQNLQKKAFALLQKSIPPDKYHSLVAQAPRLHTDAQAFAEKLPFFEVRVLYIGLAALLHGLGIPVVPALVLLSLIPYLITGGLLYFWITRCTPGSSGPCIALLGLTAIRLPQMASLQTPDMLSACLILTALYVFLEKRRLAVCLGLMAVSVLVRPDNLLLLAMLAVYAVRFAPDSHRLKSRWGWTLLAGCAAYLIAQRLLWPEVTWARLFQLSFGGSGAVPVALNTPVTPGDYGAVLWFGILRFWLDNGYFHVLPAVLLPALLCLGTVTRTGKGCDIYDHVLILMGANVLARFVLFPSMEDRYVLANVIFLLIYTIRAVTRRFAVRPA